MNKQRLLAGTLALVLIAGFGAPAFAQTTVSGDGDGDINNAASHNGLEGHDLVFDNGGDAFGESGHTMDTLFVPAEDFILDKDTVLTDVHFVAIDATPGDFETGYQYFLFENGAGEPGDLITMGTAQDVELGDRSEFTRFVWFDLEEPVKLDADTTYWIGLQSTGGTAQGVGWVFGTEGFGSQALQSAGGTFDNWTNLNFEHAWFLLTGGEFVGGEFLPIDTTALLVAGAQTNAVWILSALVAIGGVAFGALYLTSKRD